MPSILLALLTLDVTEAGLPDMVKANAFTGSLSP